MKIAVFHNLPVGGAKRVLVEQLNYLSKKHKVVVFTYSDNKDNRFILNKKIEVKKFRNNVYRNRLARDMYNFLGLSSLNKQIAKEINEQSFDVCLVHADRYFESPHILRYLKIPSLHYDQEILGICYLNDYKFKMKVSALKYFYENFFRSLLKLFDKQNMKNASKIVANSNYLARFDQKTYQRPVSYIYPGVDNKLFKPSKLSTKENFLFLGNGGEYESIEMVENAMKKVRTYFPDVEIIFLNKFNSNFKVNNDKQLKNYYSNSLATICTYIGETFGLKAIESMSCGTPVLAINKAVYPEVIVDNQTGYLINNENELAEKMIYFLNNKSESIRMGLNAQKHIKKFSWETHNKKLEKMLLSLANGKN